MNHPPFFKPLALVCAALVLSGCANQPPRSSSSLPPPDTTAADHMREHAVQESQRLLAHQQLLLAEMNKPAPAPVIAPVAPVFDPLEGKLINVAMSKASISQILSAFADAGNLNLIVDPNVLKGGQLADMHLRQVTLREGFNEVLRTYDVAGEFRGNTLRVNLTEEKFFALNFLNTKSSIQMGSGAMCSAAATPVAAAVAAAAAGAVALVRSRATSPCRARAEPTPTLISNWRVRSSRCWATAPRTVPPSSSNCNSSSNCISRTRVCLLRGFRRLCGRVGQPPADLRPCLRRPWPRWAKTAGSR